MRGILRFFKPVVVALAVAATALMTLSGGKVAWASEAEPPQSLIEGGATEIDGPQGVAVDEAGLVYVANTRGNSITVHSPRQGLVDEAPIKLLRGAGTELRGPRDIAFDDQGRMYVVQSSSVLVFAADWASGNTAPLKQLRGANTGIIDARSLAFDSTGRMYVVNSYAFRDGSGSVTVYAADWQDGDTSPVATLRGPATGLLFPQGIAFDREGAMFVTNRDSVTVYPIGWVGGDEPPRATLTGPDSGLTSPQGIAFDDAGFMYLTRQGGPGEAAIAVYAPGWPVGKTGWPSADLPTISTRGLPPVAWIRGGSTGLDRPHGIAIGPDGRLFVANEWADRISIHSPRLQVITAAGPLGIEHRSGNFDVSFSASSGLPVSIYSLTPNVCQAEGISSVNVTIEEVGICVLEARQEGDSSWHRAPTFGFATIIGPSGQVVTPSVPTSVPLETAVLRLDASTTSGLPVVWTSGTPSVCLTTGKFGRKLQLVAAGACQLMASQPGNRHWQASGAAVQLAVTSTSTPPPSLTVSCSLKATRGRISCTGTGQTLTGGTRVDVFWRTSSKDAWRQASPSTSPIVDSEGKFTWTSQVDSSRKVQVYFDADGVKSRPVWVRASSK